MEMRHTMKENFVKWILATIAWCSLLFLGLIMAFLVLESLPIFSSVSFEKFFFGMAWYPTFDPPEFGIFPLVIGSVLVTMLSSIMAIPLGVMSALWLSEIAPSVVRRVVKPLIELLAALPSVVIGLVGMILLAPVLQDYFGADTGQNLFNASVMLAFMSVPTICSVTEDALQAVPVSLREASLALGATRWETIKKIVVPASFSGIGTACMLGMSRSIGETMVVLMVAGGASIIPESIFSPVRPMPAAIVAEMAEAPVGSEHYHALFAIGLLLFLFTLLFNVLAMRISEKHRQALS